MRIERKGNRWAEIEEDARGNFRGAFLGCDWDGPNEPGHRFAWVGTRSEVDRHLNLEGGMA